MIELHLRVEKFTFDIYITIIEKIYEKEEEDKNMLDFRTETFLMVCETMNFTEAARRLHITQPAVSQHIHFLEKEYDARLFSYHNKQLYMTDAGEILKKRLMTMKNDQLVLKQEIKGKEQKEEICKLAELKYDCCTYSNKPQKTTQLREVLASHEQLNTLDIGLPQSCISRILVSHFCTVEIEFINGVVIKNIIERKMQNDHSAQCQGNSCKAANYGKQG